MNTANARSRGYHKIEGAARAFNFDFRGKTVLDIGSSTGGFTQYALDHGALKVIAVEKGTNQMLPFLRSDPRVELHEKTDVFDFKAGVAETYLSKGLRLGRAPRSGPRKIGSDRTPAFDVIMADVSFVSLRKVLAHAKAHLADKNTEFLVMLKPQFEARADQLRNGIVKNESIRRQIIKDYELWLKNHGFVIIKKRDNELKGKTGNTERFYLLKLAK